MVVPKILFGASKLIRYFGLLISCDFKVAGAVIIKIIKRHVVEMHLSRFQSERGSMCRLRPLTMDCFMEACCFLNKQIKQEKRRH
jgi:hypothetical protein